MPENVVLKDDRLSFGNKLLNEQSMIVDGSLYVRSCYKELCNMLIRETIEMKCRIVLTGTPGIGKSAFRNFVLYQLLFDFEIPICRTVIVVGSLGYIIMFKREAGSQIVNVYQVICSTFVLFIESFDSKSDFFVLYDAPRGEMNVLGRVTNHVIVFSSPNKMVLDTNRNLLSKVLFLMPLWTILELKNAFTLIKNRNMNDKEIEMVHKYGCIPRLVFTDSSVLVSSIEKSLKSIANSFSTNKNEDIHKCQFMYNRFSESGTMNYRYFGDTTDFGTPYMARKIS